MKVFMLTDTHFGIYLNNLEKWMNMMESTFYDFVIPYLRENAEPGDVLIHLGDLFDNRTSLPIIIINKVERILKEMADILPLHIMVGNHDLWNKGSNDVNSVRLYSYISDRISVYERTTTLTLDDQRLVLMPWVERRLDMIEEIRKNPGDYLFCHSDLNGCKMHLNSVAHRNADKIDVESFKGYKRAFSGHIHIRQTSANFEFIGSLYQMDRNDTGDQKGITVLDLGTGKTHFEPNTHSPVFRKFRVVDEDSIDELDTLRDTKDYIDLAISNSLLVSNRKLRRKLETMLEKGNFASVEYIDDIKKSDVENEEGIVESVVAEDGTTIDISIQLDYEKFIREYIEKREYDNESYKGGLLVEFDEVIRIYNENYKSKVE